MLDIQEVADRFQARVVCGAGDECWIWKGAKTTGGYGMFRGLLAHRWAWMYQCGDIPRGKMVLHRCDNPACVLVSHLFLGDARTNSADKVSKGRASSGPVWGGNAAGRFVVTIPDEFARIRPWRRGTWPTMVAMRGIVSSYVEAHPSGLPAPTPLQGRRAALFFPREDVAALDRALGGPSRSRSLHLSSALLWWAKNQPEVRQ